MRPGLNGGSQRLRRCLAILSSIRQGRRIDRRHPGRHGLAMGGREVALGVFVDGVLVLVALLELGVDAIFLEGATQEQGVAGEARQLEVRGVLHPKLGRRCTNHIAGNRRADGLEPLGVGDHDLARTAEAAHGLTDLVGGGGGDAGFGKTDQQGLHPIVVLGLGQNVDDLQRRQAGSTKGGEGIGRALVRHALAQVQFQHRIARRRFLGGRRADRGHDQDEGNDDDKQEQTGEHAEHGQEELLHGEGRRPDRRPCWPDATIGRKTSPSNERPVTRECAAQWGLLRRNRHDCPKRGKSLYRPPASGGLLPRVTTGQRLSCWSP